MRNPADILYNFHWVVPGVLARSAQAWLGFLGPFLRAHGIASVLNLRGPNPNHKWWVYEKRVCEARGIVHVDVMLNSRRLPTRQMLINLLDAFDAAKAPVLVKCSGGQDRSSFAAALYLLHTKGAGAIGEAHGQFARWPYLHRPKAQQRWLQPFADYACEHMKTESLRMFVTQTYTPEHLKAWLEVRGLGASFRGLYDVPGTAPGI
jgi:hypothetical protein